MSPSDLHKYRVLVVEDEPLIALAIEEMLEALGCAIVGPVAQLSEAMELAAGDAYDCAILDVNIRGGYVTAVVDTLVERGRPILLASGYADAALPSGLAGQVRLTKPYTSEQLEAGIRLLCKQIGSLD